MCACARVSVCVAVPIHLPGTGLMCMTASYPRSQENGAWVIW